jgi:ketosteroid isomerase-like protein
MAITLATTPKNPSSQLRTVLRYFELIKTLDTVELGKLFADDFVQSTRPLSLGVPSRTKEEDLAFLRGLAEKIEGRRLEVSVRSKAEKEKNIPFSRDWQLNMITNRSPCLT